MSERLRGQVAVVTGGGRGIGRGIARSLLEEGASVVISQPASAELEDAAAHLRGYGPVSAFGCDVRNRAQVQALCDHAIAEFGGLDVMVANAGIDVHRPFLEHTEDDWDRVISTNLKGAFLCGQAAAQRMVAAGTKGRIVLISSICATAAERGYVSYNASKAGIVGLCKSMAVDLADDGIVTNVVAPGWIESPGSQELVSPALLSGEERFPLNPIGRIGQPGDVAHAVAWLADPRTTFTSGSVVVVDGAQTAFLPSLSAGSAPT